MVKYIFLFFAFSSIYRLSAKAQKLIAIHHNGAAFFETLLDSAISKSNGGDTIYIPGGIFNINSPNITKKLTIIGIGNNTESSGLPGDYTRVVGSIYFLPGSDYSWLSGITLSGSIFIGNNSGTAGTLVGINISRCSFVSFSGGTVIKPSYCTFSENIINGSGATWAANYNEGNDCKNNFWGNNIFFNAIVNFDHGNYFKNNIFLNYNYYQTGIYAYHFLSIKKSTFENNITFLSSAYGFEDCDFKSNINFIPINISLTSRAIGNWWNINRDSIFEGGATSSINALEMYKFNFQLKQNSPAKNGGTDGEDVGIYGGVFAWKPGSIPHNPHIQSKKFNSKTNSNGQLPIQIKVKAQDN